MTRIVLSDDGEVGWFVDGELQIHAQPPFAPGRTAPSARVVLMPPREWDDLVHVLRERLDDGDWLRGWYAGNARHFIRANWKISAVQDDFGMQRQGWEDARIERLTGFDRRGRPQTQTVHTRRVPRYVSTGAGRPVFTLACRVHEILAGKPMVVKRIDE